ncbi:hypothetical protein PR048_024392 [Dryococelus australis]|uniref:Uncharacterized protein n=1 Tax=Dryococelus australis TaxID=614101 RepID=A0ABQ9GNH8_9NEOP|nr:hypothetical protein PR048_024392 [Dryococelus australis]
MFSDSEIAEKYSCARTKTCAIVTEIAKSEEQKFVWTLQQCAVFSLSTDGSNDSYTKLYPVVATYYNDETLMIESSVLCIPVL